MTGPLGAWVGRRARLDLARRDAALRALPGPQAPRAAGLLALARLMNALRRGPGRGSPAPPADMPARLAALLDRLEAEPGQAARLAALVARSAAALDGVALLADFGFSQRRGLMGEVLARLRDRLLPPDPDSGDGAQVVPLLLGGPGDAAWLAALDDGLLARLAPHLAGAAAAWEPAAREALGVLALQVAATGRLGAVRRRVPAEAVRDRPFEQLPACASRLLAALDAGDTATLLQEARLLRGLLAAAEEAADRVHDSLAEQGISVGLLFEMDELRGRCRRLEALLDLLLADADPLERARAWRRLAVALAEAAAERRSLRALLARHHGLLARRIAERHAETGEHYITRTRAEYRQLLGQALGGGAVIAGTTFGKFWIGALGLTAFWGGFFAGVNYALSFVLIHLLHWTVATKQPAMTAPALAGRMAGLGRPGGTEAVVDEVAHLIRSQTAGIVGNLLMVAPLVLGLQALGAALAGSPPVGPEQAAYVLHSLSLLGPTLAFAAFTGVLLFASSLVAGWAENQFVLHRLEARLRWHPGLQRRLGTARAARWAAWWRAHVSGLAANISLGLLLGLVPALAQILALPLEVRHVTLSTGQLAAALGALGPGLLAEPAFWACAAAIPLTGLLNVGVSFTLAFRVALRARGIRIQERAALAAALRRRLREAPLSFLWPPASPGDGARG